MEPVIGGFPWMPLTPSFDIYFDMRLNKRLSKQSWGWWSIGHRAHYDVTVIVYDQGWRAVCLKSDLSPKLNMNKEELNQT